ncbi:Fe-S cluster assembly protein HesB [Nocardioides sp. SYSU D00038]|uniref:Fe-S cluster assembly protein HesB n=1 Tax=Nocardioides sp. SYSU D00038 TaxID=2812554 RepID=UPI0019673444|nr:Fe-S cluster assembly protein HesB [Nocardioides sp. SYSU D00038]
MLTLTDNASTIVKNIIDSRIDADGVEATTGLRISSDEGPQPGFAVQAATQPEPGDQVVEQAGATVYLDEQAAVQLDDKVLDAAVDESGRVEFALGMQA